MKGAKDVEDVLPASIILVREASANKGAGQPESLAVEAGPGNNTSSFVGVTLAGPRRDVEMAENVVAEAGAATHQPQPPLQPWATAVPLSRRPLSVSKCVRVFVCVGGGTCICMSWHMGGRVSGRHKLHDLVTDLAPDHDRAQRYSLLQALLHGYPHNLVTLSLPAWLPT